MPETGVAYTTDAEVTEDCDVIVRSVSSEP